MVGLQRTKQCRFCLEEDAKKNLISPCYCKGSFKFVHNDCLLKWYSHEPSKALQCSVCLSPFAKTTIRPIEDLNILQPYLQLFIPHPFLYTCICNWAYAAVYSNLNSYTKIDFASSYLIYQYTLHILFFCFYGFLIYHVKNRSIYLSMWKEKHRVILFPIHLFTFFGISKTTWLGGMSSNICLMLYMFEHFDILGKINEKHNFMFISKGRGRPSIRTL